MRKIPVALQMYTIRNEAQADYVGALRTVAEIGYAGVEPAGLFIAPTEIRKALDDLGLVAPSGHFGYNQVVNQTESTAETALTLGMRYVTCAAIPVEMRDSADGFRTAGERLARAGEALAGNGLGLCYHNHNFEFTRFEGRYGLDILFEAGDARYLKAQIDTYWVKFAGEDPVDYIRRYAGRCPLVHIDDMAADGDRSFAEIGNGILDWSAIFEDCESAGVEWYIVEQGSCAGSPIDSVRASFENLKRMGIA